MNGNIPNQDMQTRARRHSVPLLPPNEFSRPDASVPNGGLLKWIGNKQRYASRIVGAFPKEFGTYYEPFLGSGAVLATLRSDNAVAADSYAPLIEIWNALRLEPETVKQWYADRWARMFNAEKKYVYEAVKASFNARPNGPDLLFLSRSCYGGVIRFRKSDGYMSTPCGIHEPIAPKSFNRRVDEWHSRIQNTTFYLCDYVQTMQRAQAGDLIYCDPPYVHAQKILYGSQNFRFHKLLDEIARCKARGVFVALSIDGHKRSGKDVLDLPIPDGLFETEHILQGGASMLKRFQSKGYQLESEQTADRLLLTY